MRRRTTTRPPVADRFLPFTQARLDLTGEALDDTDQAVQIAANGSTVLVGGVGMAGMPVDLIDALIRQGATDLTVVPKKVAY